MNAIHPPRNPRLSPRHAVPKVPRPPAVPGTRERIEDQALLKKLAGGAVCALLIIIHWITSVVR